MYRSWKYVCKMPHRPMPHHYFPSEVDVMIALFCDFCQFLAKKLTFFSKTNVMIKFFQKLAVVLSKNANIFDKFFGKNI
jgi:hypothetical protein